MLHKLNAIIEKNSYGYYAYSPELKGCQTQGDSMEEALNNLKEAAELYLKTLSPEERSLVISKTILTTSLEVDCA